MGQDEALSVSGTGGQPWVGGAGQEPPPWAFGSPPPGGAARQSFGKKVHSVEENDPEQTVNSSGICLSASRPCRCDAKSTGKDSSVVKRGRRVDECCTDFVSIKDGILYEEMLGSVYKEHVRLWV